MNLEATDHSIALSPVGVSLTSVTSHVHVDCLGVPSYLCFIRPLTTSSAFEQWLSQASPEHAPGLLS